MDDNDYKTIPVRPDLEQSRKTAKDGWTGCNPAHILWMIGELSKAYGLISTGSCDDIGEWQDLADGWVREYKEAGGT